MHDRLPHRTTSILLGCSVLFLMVGFTTKLGGDERAAVRTLQSIVDELRGQLALPVEVTASIVPTNALLVSVQPLDGRAAFQMSFQESFLDGLDADEVRTIVAHELGHVWIFTHHPYLQTEVGANDIALRVVSRQSLERVYGKVWAHQGVKGSLARFVRDPQ
jgi:hypothetical protein